MRLRRFPVLNMMNSWCCNVDVESTRLFAKLLQLWSQAAVLLVVLMPLSRFTKLDG
jgi:hypothetical protein